jgi:GNAT superfamily N-acetyltransferase
MGNGDISDIRWAQDAKEIVKLGAFFAENAVRLPEYISHGEIQYGLSRDGARWDARATDLIEAHFKRLSQNSSRVKVAGAWTGDEKPVGVAILEVVDRDKLKYVVLADILVEERWRGKGIGERMVRFIEAQMRSQGVDWLFLESGTKNEGAHKFFAHLQYRETSKIFAKRLSRRLKS